MSTFGGKIEEIPEISVDRFDGENVYSEAYFLSHCHTDHMVGLNNDFQRILLEYKKFIYVSDVSYAILKKKYPDMQNNIKVLNMYKSNIITLREKFIVVTPISAGHCPGSVMFLFQVNNTFILYTGDYRVNKKDISKFKSFYNSHNQVIAVDKIYLDTTFFSKSYLTFPRRDDALDKLCDIIKEWTDKGSDYMVHLITNATYGYEYAFNAIYKKVKMPIHVNNNCYELYSLIPEMDNAVTLEGDKTQVHCNCGTSFKSICTYSNNTRRIKVSAFRWTQDHLQDGISCLENDTYFVCYSTHASYEEGLELIRFLKPKSIEACVLHKDPDYNLEMTRLINECLREFNREENTEDQRLFDTKPNTKVPHSLESDFSDNFNILNSPPRESRENLKKFVREHSSTSIGLCTETEKMQIEPETADSILCSTGREQFNFDDEFGIAESSSKVDLVVNLSSGKESVIVISSNSVELTKIWKMERESPIACTKNLVHSEGSVPNRDMENEIKEPIRVVENAEKLEHDPFVTWLVDSSSPEYDTKETVVVKDSNDFEANGLVQSGSDKNVIDQNLSGSGSNLLNEIYFLTPHDKKNIESEKIRESVEGLERNIDKVKANVVEATSPLPWIIDLTHQNGTNRETVVNNGDKKDVEDDDVILVSDSPRELRHEKYNDVYMMGNTDSPPRKKHK